MSAEKNMNGESLKIAESKRDTVTRFQKGKTGGNIDQFYRLIESDEGVPFQLAFGKEPGDGHYLFIGDGIEKLTGIKPAQFTERCFSNMVEERVPLTANLPSEPEELRKRILSGDLSDYRLEMKVSIPGGTKKWIRETAIPLKDEGSGRITGIMGILHDISEKKLVMEYLDEAREKANETDRLKTTFLQNISHEVRTPLNAIVGFSTLLCEPEEGYYRKKEFVNMINNSTDHFLELMDNIMEISRIEAGSSSVKITDVNPSALMERLFTSFSPKATEKGIMLNCNVPDQNLVIATDSCKLYQVLHNLIGNALKFTLSGKVEYGFSINGAFIEFYVTDTGIGISEEHKAFIFNKFYQVESGSTRRFPGIGLGLSIARAYVEMLGGKISFTSKKDFGSTFRFTVPEKA